MICDFPAGEMPTHWESQDCPYLLGDLLVLLGATLQAAAASSGVLLHRSQYTALKPAAHGIFLLARCRSEPLFQGTVGAAQQSEIRTGPCTILSVFVEGGEVFRDRVDAKRWVSYVLLGWKDFCSAMR